MAMTVRRSQLREFELGVFIHAVNHFLLKTAEPSSLSLENVRHISVAQLSDEWSERQLSQPLSVGNRRLQPIWITVFLDKGIA